MGASSGRLDATTSVSLINISSENVNGAKSAATVATPKGTYMKQTLTSM